MSNRNPGIPPSAGHLAELVGRLKAEPADADHAFDVQRPEGDPVAGRERTGIPLVELPYTVGGTPEAKDLFGLFDDSIAR